VRGGDWGRLGLGKELFFYFWNKKEKKKKEKDSTQKT